MGIFKNFIYNKAMYAAERTGYTLQKIELMRKKSLQSLYNKWSDMDYEQLEAARMLAKSEGHWFEELQILIDEVTLLIDRYDDKQRYYTANQRLQEMHEVFLLDNAVFAEKYKENYLYTINKILWNQVDEYLKGFSDYYYERADYMLAHLQYDTAVLCGEAICKIASVSDVVSFENHIETLFQIAIAYGNKEEYTKAMEYYNKAFDMARDAGDTTYEYISIIRKASICIGMIDLGVLIDFDLERLSVAQDLIALCDRYNLNPYELGQKLLEEEVSEFRKNRICEAMPFINNLVALQHGDWLTAFYSMEELKEAESKVYGGNSQYSNSEMLAKVYEWFYNSAARSQSVEEESVEEESVEDASDTEDVVYDLSFLDGMFAVDKFRWLLLMFQVEIAQSHFDCASHLAREVGKVAQKVYSDYSKAQSIQMLGQIYEESGNKEEAVRLYKEVVRMFTAPLPAGSDLSMSKKLLYITLSKLANLKIDSAPVEAVKILSRALDCIDDSADLIRNSFRLDVLLCRSKVYWKLKQYNQSEKDILEAIDWVISQATRRLPTMDGDLRENFWMAINSIIKKIVQEVDDSNSVALRKRVYELVLYAKGFLLSSERAMKKAVYSEESSDEIRNLYEDLELQAQNKKIWGSSTEDSSKEYVDSYMKRMRLTCALSGIVGRYYDYINQSYDDVVEKMGADEVVVDYIDFETENQDVQYLAFVFRKMDEAPHIIPVCRESEIADVYNGDWSVDSRLTDLLWTGIIKKYHIAATEHVFFVPCGSLAIVPIESLKSDTVDCTLEETYSSFIRLSHVRELSNCKNKSSIDDIALFGGLDYGEGAKDSTTERGYRIGKYARLCTELLPWDNLVGTRIEVQKISFRCHMSGIKTTCFCGTEGTCDAFKAWDGQAPAIVHLATHGFFETKVSASNLPALRGRFSAMDLSGLVMSNGNKGWLYGSPLHHEGILTAADIARMDLSNTSLVVLSACNSGNGSIQSDGVYGLQRAFKKAGVQTILMSLWNESDEVGEMFMSYFYNYLLTGDCSKRQAFTLAKNEVKKSYPHPFYWANFVMLD